MANEIQKYRLEPDVPYKAFSGANIQATIGNRSVGSLQSIQVSVTREVAALYAMGSADVKTFVKGKRGIAGSLVFTQFDRHALLQDVFRDGYQTAFADQEASNLFSSRFTALTAADDLLGAPLQGTRNFAHDLSNTSINKSFGSEVAADLAQHLRDVYQMVGSQKLRYSDQIPEFDITLTMVNESGDAAFVVVGGITLVNEGWGYTMDDLSSDVAYTFVARYVTPLASLTQGDLFRKRGNRR